MMCKRFGTTGKRDDKDKVPLGLEMGSACVIYFNTEDMAWDSHLR